MLLSVIIVNYNVKCFLEQCLCSVKKALNTGFQMNGAETLSEVIVVDNHSTDSSIAYLHPRFPWVQFINNKENIGFGSANNQALKQAKGKYIVFLNPDTIVPEDIFKKTIAFMEAHAQTGVVGVRMIDGSGKFLKESKRGLPTPWVSFCKMSGLTAMFPRSAVFANYYQGHLNEHTTQEVPVLAGAFMLASKDVLNEVGGFDEQFFMYAEDIDLSYRILKAGYKNYYFAETTIIHFKGESTRKDAKYVKLFYKAMQQFVQKHYRTRSGFLFSGLMNGAIRFRSGISLLRPSPKNKSEDLSAVQLKGDPRSVQQLNAVLFKNGIGVQDKSVIIIFCEGQHYAFHQIITDLQQLQPGEKALLHASNSNSIVGSFDKYDQGIVLEIVNA